MYIQTSKKSNSLQVSGELPWKWQDRQQSMNKPSQCRCPFQLISDICQCHISPRNPSVINHLQQRSHSHLGISEHAEGKVILLMSLFFQIFTGLCLGERGTRAQTCQVMQINRVTAQELTHGHAASQGVLPTPVLTVLGLCPTPASPWTSEQVPCSGKYHRLLQLLLERSEVVLTRRVIRRWRFLMESPDGDTITLLTSCDWFPVLCWLMGWFRVASSMLSRIWKTFNNFLADRGPTPWHTAPQAVRSLWWCSFFGMREDKGDRIFSVQAFQFNG